MASSAADEHARSSRAPSDPKDASRGERIQKVLARAGIGSRRHCEELVEQGQVRVNGRVVDELPAWVDPMADDIVVNGRPVPKAERHVYVMLYKPRNTLSTLSDPDHRRTVADLVQHPSVDRLYPVGRLDYDTMGLLLMTNDGELANRLTHPRYGVHKTYRAVVKGAVSGRGASRDRSSGSGPDDSGRDADRGAEPAGAADARARRPSREEADADSDGSAQAQGAAAW